MLPLNASSSIAGIAKLSLAEFAHYCGTPLDRLLALAEAGSAAYMPKFNGGSEFKPRWIRPPRSELKDVQKRILRLVLQDIPPHAATCSARGRGGVLQAASKHIGNPYLLHADIRTFFPSVSPVRVLSRLMTIPMKEDVASLITGLVTVDGQLPQGAPTSSAIGDLVLFPLDCRIAKFAKINSLVYTRYMDDIAVSGGAKVKSFAQRMVTKMVSDDGWRLNDKGDVFGPERRKEILGVIVGHKLSVPAIYRSKIRSILKLASVGKITLSPSELSSIRGKIAWIFAVNPQQGHRLRLLLDTVPNN